MILVMIELFCVLTRYELINVIKLHNINHTHKHTQMSTCNQENMNKIGRSYQGDYLGCDIELNFARCYHWGNRMKGI